MRFFDRGSNLHAVWDTDIITPAQSDEEKWVADLGTLDTPEALLEAQKGTAEDWATESLLAAREAYQDPKTGQRIKAGAKLGGEYQAQSLPAAKQRLYQASARLALVINESLREN